MRALLTWALAALSPAVSMASVQPPPLPDNRSEVHLVGFSAPPATVTCAQGSARPIEAAPPTPRTWQTWRPAVGGTAPVPPQPTHAVLSFSVSADGRVLDIKNTTPSTMWLAQEQAATLATWRFASGAPASGCKVDFAPTYTPVAQASPARLFELLAAEGRNTPLAVREALSASSDCTGHRRRPQTIVYPDLRAFDDKRTDPAWTVVRYDIDANGAVRNVQVAAQHGEAAFADVAASAVAEGKYFPGPARSGCFMRFKAQPRITEAPAKPDINSFKRPGDTCDLPPEALKISQSRIYPNAYNTRRVAGWAIVRFDVAPWGQVGAVEVLAAQPSAAFGDAALSLVQSARIAPSTSGYHGCVTPITYAIPQSPDDDD